MIVTVTPNPSIDRTIAIDAIERGGLIRARRATSEAAGKGLNVSRALAEQGVETIAVLPLASDTAATYLGLLAGAIPLRTVSIPGAVRTNVSLVEPDGTVTKVNEPGPILSEAQAEAILAAATDATREGWIVGCGSLPPGAPLDFYARLARLASSDRRIAVDSSGEALAAAASAGASLIKPNLSELETIAGRKLTTLGEAVDAACETVAAGVGSVLLSVGRHGAVWVDSGGTVVHAEAAVPDAVNNVGAGDALLAGFLARGAGAPALSEAVAWSIAALRSPGTRMLPLTDADRRAVVVHDRVDRDRVLSA